jgi:signal transduction histidine kinase
VRHKSHRMRRWRDDDSWPPFEHPMSRWPRAMRRQRGMFFMRFVAVFGLMILLVLGGMAAFAFLLSHFFEGGGRMAGLVWIGGCGLSLALPLLGGAVAMRVFRGITTPMADIMSAADAVAEGDLSARVPEPEQGPREFRRLAKSFNHMTAELEHAELQRRNLTADVAHELRTPLHIIQGNLEGMLDGVYDASSQHVNATLDETHLLARLVEDLQTLSLAEAGELPMHMVSVDIFDLLEDVRTSFSGQAEAAGVVLIVDAEKISVIGDGDRLDQVLSNLVANALRHTPTGGRISLKAAANLTGVLMSVKDTGEGIPPENLEYIFDRFWKGDRSRGRTVGHGSGLGLAIARQLVRNHGGQISVESELGQGSEFVISLPSQS